MVPRPWLLRARKRVLLAVIVASFLLRLAVAPYSAGSDIAQFRGFAESFNDGPICMYIYSEKQDGWPYNWLYVYPPVMGLILSGLSKLTDASVSFYWENSVYRVIVEREWIVAVKSVYIAGDALLVALLYRYWGPLPATAYAASPASIYNSSIYGMFDHLAAIPLIASIIAASRSRMAVAGILLGASILVKQTMLLPALSILFSLAGRGDRRGLILAVSSMALAVSALVAPFMVLCPSASYSVKSLVSYLSRIYYPEPIVYSFNGLSSLASYLHRFEGIDSIALVRSWLPLFILFAAISAYTVLRLGSREYGGPLLVKSAALGYMAFTATYWRVNYQYLIPLAVLSL
ncbi:MAG: glycosyltransferase 87 family protein, partial [Desulfurococcales archaeon]|nr:glycosyltransferase 87 family protein [Desulfurococcales archaeon]